jgi:hypothetical protein
MADVGKVAGNTPVVRHAAARGRDHGVEGATLMNPPPFPAPGKPAEEALVPKL